MTRKEPRTDPRGVPLTRYRFGQAPPSLEDALARLRAYRDYPKDELMPEDFEQWQIMDALIVAVLEYHDR